MLFHLNVKRVNKKLLEKQPVCTAGATAGAQGRLGTGFGDALLPAFVESGSSKGCVWAGASFPIERCTTFYGSRVGMVTVVLVLPGEDRGAGDLSPFPSLGPVFLGEKGEGKACEAGREAQHLSRL